jgi:hypothetical protein
VTWATPTTTVVTEEESPLASIAIVPKPVETKAILKGSTQNVTSASTMSLATAATRYRLYESPFRPKSFRNNFYLMYIVDEISTNPAQNFRQIFGEKCLN